MANGKYYVVWVGNVPGVYESWAECKKQIDHYPNAKYKSYPSKDVAIEAYALGWKQALYGNDSKKLVNNKEINYNSISVDVGSSGNPGIIEYKGVDTQTGEQLFYYGPIAKGTNNLGEFLAIVHALAYIEKKGLEKSIYSDSQTAISWVKNKKVNSNLTRDESTKEIWTLVDRALNWLLHHSYSTKIEKWNTVEWGEIKADFGRK